MPRIEIEIKNAKDRAEVGRILLENSYRVWTETVKKGSSTAKTTLLCADRCGKEASA